MPWNFGLDKYICIPHVNDVQLTEYTQEYLFYAHHLHDYINFTKFKTDVPIIKFIKTSRIQGFQN